jgi:hypothetical protein
MIREGSALLRGRRSGRRRGGSSVRRHGWGRRDGAGVGQRSCHAIFGQTLRVRLLKNLFRRELRLPVLAPTRVRWLEVVFPVGINGPVDRITAGQADGERHEAQCDQGTKWAGHSFLYEISLVAVNLRNEQNLNQRRILPAASRMCPYHKSNHNGPRNDPW